MMRFESEFIDELQTGDIISINDPAHLAEFEDAVAMAVSPEMTPTHLLAWKGRAALHDFIRPPKFYGTIRDISLEVMDEPYARLFDARERGLQFAPGTRAPLVRTNRDSIEDAKILSKGFVLTAEAVSSGKGSLGQVSNELWYIPAPRVIDRRDKEDTPIRRSTSVSHTVVQRYIAKPIDEHRAFLARDTEAKRKGIVARGKIPYFSRTHSGTFND